MPRRKRTGPTKMELVRKALTAGIDKPTDIVGHIKKQGIDINTGQVSNYKSLLKKEGVVATTNGVAKNGRRGRKPGRKPQASVAAKIGNFAIAVGHIKQLCQQLGTNQVKQLADLFA
jgi:hypothetical protein